MRGAGEAARRPQVRQPAVVALLGFQEVVQQAAGGAEQVGGVGVGVVEAVAGQVGHGVLALQGLGGVGGAEAPARARGARAGERQGGDGLGLLAVF